jgi:hypothetical protein
MCTSIPELLPVGGGGFIRESGMESVKDKYYGKIKDSVRE